LRNRISNLLLGGVLTLAVTILAAILSAWPLWRSLPEDTALLRLSFTRSGERACRERTPEELQALPPNMRQRRICDRSRPPIYVELDVDGATVFAATVPPTGLAGTGPSRIYKRFVLPAGAHSVAVRMRDRPTTKGFDYEASARVNLRPSQSYVIDFRAEAGGFIFK
jgi:hypothetical protein